MICLLHRDTVNICNAVRTKRISYVNIYGEKFHIGDICAGSLTKELPVRYTHILVISNHTCGDEHDASSEAHLGLGGVFHADHRDAGQGEN